MTTSRLASNRRGRLPTIMRLTGKTPWLFAAALAAAVACGGVSDQNFYEGPAKRVAQSGGTGGVGAGTSVGGGAGHAPSTGGTAGSTGASGGTVATGGGSTGGGGDATGGGSGGGGNEAAIGGSGNAAATGGSGDAPAAGGTAPATGGTTGGDAGAGDAPSGGTGGDVSPGGMGGTNPMAGTGGTAGQTGGTGNVGGAGMSGAGMSGAGTGGTAGKATGGRGGRGGTGNDCTMKLKQVEDKLAAAQVCNRALDASCLGFVEDECGCEVPVNNPSSAAAKAYLAAIEDAAGCFACTEALCPTATGAYCQGSGAALEGLCVSSQFSTF